MARPTDVERAQKARYVEQESKRATRIQVDQTTMLRVWLGAIGFAFLTAAVISFNGITSLAHTVGLTFEWMAYLFFFFVELMYLLFLVAYLVLKSRGERAWGAFAGTLFFGGVAVGANAWHTIEHWNFDWGNLSIYPGLVLSVSAPLAIIASSKLVGRVALAETVKEI